MKNQIPRCIAGAVLLCAATGLLTGCNKTPSSGSSQVVAKVDGTEITVYQLNAVLMRLPPMDAAKLDETKAEIIRSLVEQQAVVNQALKLKLDRTPDAAILLQASRDSMLSQLYFADYLQHVTKPTQAEVQAYYREHPLSYSARKSLSILQLEISNPEPALKSRLGAVASSGETLEAVAAKLRADGIANALALIETGTDKFAPATAAALAEAAPGAIVVDADVAGGSFRLIQLRSAASAPIDLSAADADIREKLGGEKTKLEFKNQLQRLVQSAKVDYVGDFAKYRNVANGESAATVDASGVK